MATTITKVFDNVVINDISLLDFNDVILNGINGKEGLTITVTPNIDHFQRLRNSNNDFFNKAYQIATYRLCDSRIVQKLSKLKGKENSIEHVVPGSDLTKFLLQQPLIKQSKITVIGTSDKEIKKIIEKYQLMNVQHYNPPMGFVKDPKEVSKSIDFIIESNPDVVFLAVGSPAQEHLAYALFEKVGSNNTLSTQIFCIGASLDFLSGKTKRAPAWMQKSHLEWLHRACSQPKRLIPRYFNNLKYIIRFVFGGK